MKKLLLITLTLLGFSCARMGTETGNPFDGGSIEDCNGNKRCMPSPMVATLSSVIASKVQECVGNSANPTQIFESVFAEPGLDLELPLPYSNFVSLQTAYENKLLTVDIDAHEQCATMINQLRCDSSVFTNAFDVNHLNDYSNIHKILRADSVCKEIFKIKTESL